MKGTFWPYLALQYLLNICHTTAPLSMEIIMNSFIEYFYFLNFKETMSKKLEATPDLWYRNYYCCICSRLVGSIIDVASGIWGYS